MMVWADVQKGDWRVRILRSASKGFGAHAKRLSSGLPWKCTLTGLCLYPNGKFDTPRKVAEWLWLLQERESPQALNEAQFFAEVREVNFERYKRIRKKWNAESAPAWRWVKRHNAMRTRMSKTGFAGDWENGMTWKEDGLDFRATLRPDEWTDAAEWLGEFVDVEPSDGDFIRFERQPFGSGFHSEKRRFFVWERGEGLASEQASLSKAGMSRNAAWLTALGYMRHAADRLTRAYNGDWQEMMLEVVCSLDGLELASDGMGGFESDSDDEYFIESAFDIADGLQGEAIERLHDLAESTARFLHPGKAANDENE